MKDCKFYFNVTRFDIEEWYKETLKSLLKPCPFCGSNDLAIHVPNNDNKEDITCTKCGCKMQRVLGVGVVFAWNQRTDGCMRRFA